MTKKIRRTIQVDMSPQAIALRMRELAQLYKLGMSIKKAKPVGKFKQLQNMQSGEKSSNFAIKPTR